MFWTTTAFLVAYLVLLITIIVVCLMFFGTCLSILNMTYSMVKLLKEIKSDLKIVNVKTTNQIIENDTYK